MNIRACSLALAVACAVTLPALANDAASQPEKVSSGVKLSTLCDHCSVVDSVTTVTRKGKASGVGAVGGAVLGGVVGHQLGGGTGKTVLTAGGAVAGGLAGNEIEKNMKKYTVWVTHVTLKNGTHRTFEERAAPAFRKGDVVKVDGNRIVKS